MSRAAISDEVRDGLNIALNEAAWVGISVDVEARQARLLLDALSLPLAGPVPPVSPAVITTDR